MRRILLALLVFTSTLPTWVMSANLNFMNSSDSAVRFFTDNDWKLFNSAVETALNKSPNGKKVSWKNPDSGSYGFVTPLNKFKKNGTTCRDLKMANNANNRTGQYTFTFCKYPSGWKIPSD